MSQARDLGMCITLSDDSLGAVTAADEGSALAALDSFENRIFLPTIDEATNRLADGGLRVYCEREALLINESQRTQFKF